jgi:hypothetical protein
MAKGSFKDYCTDLLQHVSKIDYFEQRGFKPIQKGWRIEINCPKGCLKADGTPTRIFYPTVPKGDFINGCPNVACDHPNQTFQALVMNSHNKTVIGEEFEESIRILAEFSNFPNYEQWVLNLSKDVPLPSIAKQTHVPPVKSEQVNKVASAPSTVAPGLANAVAGANALGEHVKPVTVKPRPDLSEFKLDDGRPRYELIENLIKEGYEDKLISEYNRGKKVAQIYYPEMLNQNVKHFRNYYSESEWISRHKEEEHWRDNPDSKPVYDSNSTVSRAAAFRKETAEKTTKVCLNLTEAQTDWATFNKGLSTKIAILKGMVKRGDFGGIPETEFRKMCVAFNVDLPAPFISDIELVSDKQEYFDPNNMSN